MDTDDGYFDWAAPALTLPGSTVAPFSSKNTLYSLEAFWGLILLPPQDPSASSHQQIPAHLFRTLWNQAVLGDIAGSMKLSLANASTLQRYAVTAMPLTFFLLSHALEAQFHHLFPFTKNCRALPMQVKVIFVIDHSYAHPSENMNLDITVVDIIPLKQRKKLEADESHHAISLSFCILLSPCDDQKICPFVSVYAFTFTFIQMRRMLYFLDP